MTKAGKRKFIRDLTKSVCAELVAKVDSMPEEWDGHELRRLIADKFAFEVWTPVMSGKRLKDFKNEVLTRNL